MIGSEQTAFQPLTLAPPARRGGGGRFCGGGILRTGGGGLRRGGGGLRLFEPLTGTGGGRRSGVGGGLGRAGGGGLGGGGRGGGGLAGDGGGEGGRGKQLGSSASIRPSQSSSSPFAHVSCHTQISICQSIVGTSVSRP